MAEPNKYVDWFVDRVDQLQAFSWLLERKVAQQIMVVQADPEMGKTFLLQRLYHDLRDANHPVVLIDLREPSSLGAWNFLSIVRTVRNQLGSALFNDLTTAINSATEFQVRIDAPAPVGNVTVNVATDGGQVSNSTVQFGDIAAGNIIKDNLFKIDADSDSVRQAIEGKITDAFFACLSAFQQENIVTLLFDAYETVLGQPADGWVRGELLTRIRDGRLPHVIVILATRQPVLDASWKSWSGWTRLTEFTEQDITLYATTTIGLNETEAKVLFDGSGGMPPLVGMMVANIVKRRKASQASGANAIFGGMGPPA
jgi:hypothetical protein